MHKLLISLVILTGCGEYNKPVFYSVPKLVDVEEPEELETCTVIQENNQATILCPDGTSAVITNGKDGEDGRRGEQGIKGDAGERGETGETGPVGASGQDGKDGQDGVDGTDGTDGVDGISPEPCTVYELNKNFIRIECPDGTFQDIRKK